MDDYNSAFPEQGNWWKRIDSVRLSMFAGLLIERLNKENALREASGRNYVPVYLPGLRESLRMIAKESGVSE